MQHSLRSRSLSARLLVLVSLLVSSVACNARYSNAAFHLPADGNAEQGKAAFVALGCTSCHQVAGVTLPASDLRTPPILLGGEVDRKMTDAYLVTHMVDPSNRQSSGSARITAAGQVHMPGYADRLTVRQLTDIVTFLQAHYRLSPLPTDRWYQ